MLGLPATISVALFDMDGVLTSTAIVHRGAWKRVFDKFLQERDGDEFAEFTEGDYLQYVDGRTRRDGVRAFLRSRDIDPTDRIVEEISAAKNDLAMAAITNGDFEVYPGSVRYLTAARDAGLGIGVVTSSENCGAVLDAADLTGFVQHRVDGLVIARDQLRGKPAPDSFLAAARAFGVEPAAAAVFEDAVSGVQAGAAGQFGYVVGIDRVGGDQAAAMRAAGADVVIGDLQDLLE